MAAERTGASCTACGSPQHPSAWRCECGGVFDLPEIPAGPISELPAATRGVRRYAAWIPVAPEPLARISMGEGGSALIPAPLEGVHLKLEYVSPTLSFKDRGAVVLVASALERGARRLIADSSGNAGSAIAAYASRAGLECRVFVPSGTSAAKRAQIRSYGASLEVVAGDRTATSAAAIATVEQSGAVYASHVYDPMFLQGTKTFAFEVFEQLGGVPDAMVIPVGNGTLLLGAARGFDELRSGGVVDRVPALIGVQSERCAPLATAWASRSPAPATVEAERTAAEGIAIPRPARGAQILSAVAASGGCVVGVPEAMIEPAQRQLARCGLLVEPTAAIAWAALVLARDDSGAAQEAGTTGQAAGTALRAAGSAWRQADSAVRAAGSAWRQADSAWRQADSAVRAAGSARQHANSAVQAAGSARQQVGTAWQRARRLSAGTVVVPLCGSGVKTG